MMESESKMQPIIEKLMLSLDDTIKNRVDEKIRLSLDEINVRLDEIEETVNRIDKRSTDVESSIENPPIWVIKVDKEFLSELVKKIEQIVVNKINELVEKVTDELKILDGVGV
jgi:archaellum component FlaC